MKEALIIAGIIIAVIVVMIVLLASGIRAMLYFDISTIKSAGNSAEMYSATIRPRSLGCHLHIN